jgi:beta-RFAP synthase
MTSRQVTVTAPSRLHFGLFAAANVRAGPVGGIGLMLDRPRSQVRLARSARLEVTADEPGRILRVVRQWFSLRAVNLGIAPSCAEELPIAIRHLAGPPPHIGLGSGTQLALSVVAGLDRWFEISSELSVDHAMHFGRGRRSAVGSAGFLQGGLICDFGEGDSAAGSQRLTGLPLPRDWRVVLFRPVHGRGLHGPEEEELFAALSPSDERHRRGLRQIATDAILPAARAADFEAFSAAIHELNFRAGLLFAAFQQGPFNGGNLSRMIAYLRNAGVSGVGQSSWGPTGFALCADPAAAERVRRLLEANFQSELTWLETAAIASRGHVLCETKAGASTMEWPRIARR